MIPLLIVDYRVLVFSALGCLEKIPSVNPVTNQPANDLRNTFVQNIWPYILNRGTDVLNLREFTTVIVDDQKVPTTQLSDDLYGQMLDMGSKLLPDAVYWRNLYYPEYKHGRKDKPADYGSVLAAGHNYFGNPKYPGYYLSKPLFEADDWAGAIVSYKRLCVNAVARGMANEVTTAIANRPIYLWTVDSDWLQLVGDGVEWVNTGPWQPRLRGPKEAVTWWNKKREHRNHQIDSHLSIVSGKCVLGDKSDNLPPGTDRHLIDLTNPPHKWNLRRLEPSILYQVLTDNTNTRHEGHYSRAKQILLANNLPLPC